MRLSDPKHPANRLYVSDFVIEQMQKIPTIEAEPVKHGRWGGNGIPESMLSKCSVCDYSCGAYSFNYCPNCGAKMRERRDNTEAD